MTAYAITGRCRPGGEATLEVFGRSLRVDAGASRDLVHPGPAELLCGALAACLLKNVERFHQILPFRYEGARVHVTAVRQERPPRFTQFTYRLELVTDESAHRVELLHKNVRKFGTVSGTLGLAAELVGEIVVVESIDG